MWSRLMKIIWCRFKWIHIVGGRIASKQHSLDIHRLCSSILLCNNAHVYSCEMYTVMSEFVRLHSCRLGPFWHVTSKKMDIWAVAPHAPNVECHKNNLTCITWPGVQMLYDLSIEHMISILIFAFPRQNWTEDENCNSSFDVNIRLLVITWVYYFIVVSSCTSNL